MDERIIKVKFSREKRGDGLSIYPWNFIKHTPPANAFLTPIGER